MHPYRRLLTFLALYKYQVIFPVAIIEGPVVTVLSGILAARGTLSFLPAFAVVFAADMVSDPAFYLLGRFGRRLLQEFPLVRLPAALMNRLERQYERDPWKTMIVGKLSYGLGSLFMTAAGASRMPPLKFLAYVGLLDAAKSLLLLTLGYFCGRRSCIGAPICSTTRSR